MTAERSENQDMEQAILDAAERLFLARGFALTSTTEIAKEAGCNQALVHYYYRTKDRLFSAIFATKVKLFVSAFIKSSGEDLPFEEKFRRKIEAHFDILAANPRLPFLVFNELITNPERVKLVKEKVAPLLFEALGQFKRELDEAIAQGVIRPIEPLDLVMNVVSLNVALFVADPILREVLGIDDKGFAALVARRREETVRTILNSLRPL
ncbi:MAG TPA: TetR/AcrR family transcriptional regulator [Treponemataceae bacterium]|nr:TetR/AcrR family transcriptional regulator [Treponemataceae bacterium]